MRINKNRKSQLLKALKEIQSVLKGQKDCESAVSTLVKSINILEVEEAVNTSAFSLTQALKDSFDWIAFSDGACRGNPGPGAWGSIVQRPNEELIFEGSGVEVRTTNNRMELQGAIECLKFLQSFSEFSNSDKVVLVSDSKYVVDGLTKWVKGWKSRGWKKADKKTPENVEIWQELDALASEMPSLQLQWVKGHSGHPQNEYCDQLANKALDEAGF